MPVPGTHHTALYQTDFIRATKKRVTASQPALPSPTEPPPRGEETRSWGCSGWTPSPGAARDVSRWPGGCLGGRHEAKGADALPPCCGWGRVLPRRGPQGLLSPTLQGDHCRAATAPQSLSLQPQPARQRPWAQLPAPLPWAARRGRTRRQGQTDGARDKTASYSRPGPAEGVPGAPPPFPPPRLGYASPSHPASPCPRSRARASPAVRPGRGGGWSRR